MIHYKIFAHTDFMAKIARSDEAPLQSTMSPVLNQNSVGSASAVKISHSLISDEYGKHDYG